MMPSLPSIHALSSDDDVGEKPPRKGSTLTPGPTRQKVQRLVSRSASSTWEPVSELTDDSSSHGADVKDVGVRKRERKSRKKTLGGLSLREQLVSDLHCKATLGRMCKGCKRPCLAVFRQFFGQGGGSSTLWIFGRSGKTRTSWIKTEWCFGVHCSSYCNHTGLEF